MRLLITICVCLALYERATCLPSSTRLGTPLTPSEDYTHSLIVDDDDPERYQLFWKLVDNEDFIQFEAHCKSTGWVGFGLSPNGDMPGADITIGWVDDVDSTIYLRDTHAVARAPPLVDKSQDVRLIEGKQVDGYTMLKFKRPLKTCDVDDDIEIKKETNYLIFAWNNQDPVGDNWLYHGPNRRIVVDMLLNFKPVDQNLEALIQESENAEKIDFTLKNHPIKAQDTYYHCQIFTMLPSDIDRQMIRYDVLVSPGNKDIVHHMVLHECDSRIELLLPFYPNLPDFGDECGSNPAAMPINICLGSPIIAIWGVGGNKNYFFPPDTGYPFASSNKLRYFMIEYHFDNPRMQENRVDSSGIRMYLTSNLKINDIGVLAFGSGVNNWDIQIPPRINNITISSVCYPECFDKFAPDGGITVFSGFLHTHLAGRSITTKLVRNNEIIMNLFDNPKYDFNYQFNIEVEPVKLYKGDSLIVECSFNTMDRNKFTFWGFSTYEEMCFSFLYYYPKMPSLFTCFSVPSVGEMKNFYPELVNEGLLPEYVTSDANDTWNYGIQIYEKLKNVTEFSDELSKRYIDYYATPSEHLGYCGSDLYPSEIIDDIRPYPKPTNGIKEEIKECIGNGLDTTTTPSTNPTYATSLTTTKDNGSGNSASAIFDKFGLKSILTTVFFLVVYHISN